jgi:hypothetical protein
MFLFLGDVNINNCVVVWCNSWYLAYLEVLFQIIAGSSCSIKTNCSSCYIHTLSLPPFVRHTPSTRELDVVLDRISHTKMILNRLRCHTHTTNFVVRTGHWLVSPLTHRFDSGRAHPLACTFYFACGTFPLNASGFILMSWMFHWSCKTTSKSPLCQEVQNDE